MSQDYQASTVVAGPEGGARLRVELPGGVAYDAALPMGQTVVGRGQDADLILEESSVSRRHALFTLSGGQLVMRDLGSANGSLVNGQRVQEAQLRPGDVISLGQARLTLVEVLEASIAPPLAQTGQATVVQAASPPRPAKSGGKNRRLVLVGGLAGLAVVALIVVVSSLGGGDGKTPAPGEAPPVVTPPQASPSATSPSTIPKPVAPGLSPASQEPPPPIPSANPALAAKHLQSGQTYYEAGHLHDAAQEFRHALELDPGLLAARTKLDRVEQEIMQQAEEAFRLGLQSFNYLNYESAIQQWMRVLNLVPDPQHPLHQKTADYLAQARAKLGR